MPTPKTTPSIANLPCHECFTLSAALEGGTIRCTDPLCGAVRKA